MAGASNFGARITIAKSADCLSRMYRIGPISTLYSHFSLHGSCRGTSLFTARLVSWDLIFGTGDGSGIRLPGASSASHVPKRPLDASERVSGPTAAIFAAPRPKHSDVSTFWSKTLPNLRVRWLPGSDVTGP